MNPRASSHLKLGRRLTVIVLLSPLLLIGCAPEPTDTPTGSAAAPQTEPGSSAADTASDDAATEEATPRAQPESCDWDAGKLPSALPSALPSGQEGELQTVIIGAWQHTHFDSGGGYEALESEDIRYVFPADGRLLYCQHVPGVTDHAENSTDFTWEGNAIAIPGGAPGFEVTDWNDETMIWTNRMDDSRYLLQRR